MFIIPRIPKNRRKINGKWYNRHSFWNTKAKAEMYGEDLRQKEAMFPKGHNSVKMIKGTDGITGEKGYWLFVRRKHAKSKKFTTVKTTRKGHVKLNKKGEPKTKKARVRT